MTYSLKDDKTKHYIITLDKEGKSQQEISEITGIGKSTIGDFIRRESFGSFWANYSKKEIVKNEQSVHDKVQPLKVITSNYKPDGCNHFFIPDTQCKDGIDMSYLSWIGSYIVDRKPDVIIHIGDHADMPSLSSYDKGKKKAEGRRVQIDINAAIRGMNLLLAPIVALQQEELDKWGEVLYKPRMVLTLGNHEERIMRHVEANPELAGFLSYDDLKYKEMGWEVYDFLEPVVINGVAYCHYMANPMTGRPYGGMAATVLKQVGESFSMGHVQKLDFATRNLPASGKQQWAIQAGACLEENHKVLTSDLRYVKLKDISVGDTLVSFEETVVDKRSRRYKKGTVQAIKKVPKETFKVSLESGKEFIVTDDHLWFVKTGNRYRWVETNKLRKGTCIPKLFPEWETDLSNDAGWLAGMYDGEGSLYQRNTSGGSCFQLSISQKEGITNDKLVKVLGNYGETTTTSEDNRKKDKIVSHRIKGGVPNCLKVLGTVRPGRLLSKFNPDKMGRICCPDFNNDKVISITPSGVNTIVEIDIDTKTMIVEGYGHHNCYLHDEDYKGYQGNHHWRGVIVKHHVIQGSYNPMFVDLDYLRRKYDN